ncbi:ABC transporter ATP-binding protein [Kineococcus gynurae]|uniref:ABC transporter ATP-binding protein n=1 Tax=Kineococcus gynurae TaxID=452979 RepID=A0ABV5LR99_9ACTN
MSAVLPVAPGRRALRVLARTAAGHRRLTAATVVAVLAASAGTVAAPLLVGRVVDVVAAGDRAGLPPLVVGLAVLAVLAAVATASAQRLSERLGATVMADLREDVVDSALRMRPATLEAAGSGDVATRVTEDVDLVTSQVPLLSTVTTSLVVVVFSTIGFAALDWRLALAFAVVFPLYVVTLRAYLPVAGPLYAAERLRAGERSRVVLESLHAQATVHAYGMGEAQTERVRQASRRAAAAARATLRPVVRLSVSMNSAEAVGLATLLSTGFFLVRADVVGVGSVTAAALLFHRLFGPLGSLLMSFDDVQRAGAALTRLVGVADLPRPATGADRAPDRPLGLRARGVHHVYPGTRHDVLSGVDVDVPPGTSLAVVGGSGAGKTTLAAILGGVFEPTAGSVELLPSDGPAVPSTDLDPEQLRERVAVVAQENHVGRGSVREHLTLAAPTADDDDLLAALAAVHAADWVRALPAGLDTRLGPGEHRLTGAQEQQLALARVELRDPAVVVLDEATAEAGSAGARDLERAAAAVVRGRTAVVVAHRLTQAAACDRIAVLEAGTVVELGTHAELLAAEGRYARLWSAWSAGAGQRA